MPVSAMGLNTPLYLTRFALRFSMQVLRSLCIADEQHIEGGRGGEKVTLLWQNLKRAAYSETDPIARHFLRSIVTPDFQVRLLLYSVLVPRTVCHGIWQYVAYPL